MATAKDKKATKTKAASTKKETLKAKPVAASAVSKKEAQKKISPARKAPTLNVPALISTGSLMPVRLNLKKTTPVAKPKLVNIFFTGFPGFIGKRIIRALLSSESNLFFNFLIQEKFRKMAESSIEQISAEFPKFASNHKLIAGDLTKNQFGLDDEAYNKLAASTSIVWHLAAVYDLAVPEGIAYQINVEGTRRILDFCEKAPHLKKFVYFSTCYVSGFRTGLILEDELNHEKGFKNHYESTKYEAEVLVRRCGDKIPTIIIRPSIVIGDSVSGETDKFDGPYFLMRLFADLERRNFLIKGLRLPSLGRAGAYFNLVPIDYLINAVIHIQNDPRNFGKCFQVCDPNPLKGREFYDEVYQIFGLGKTWGVLPSSLVIWSATLPKLGKFMGIPHQAIPYMEHYAVYDCKNTLSALEGAGIRCPYLKDYLPTLANYVRKHVTDRGLRAKY